MPLNSEAGQGTLLGLLCFCIMFNGAGPKPSLEPLGQVMTQIRKDRKPIKTGKKKWVDDCTLTDPIRLHNKLVQDTRPKIIGPAQFHDRTGQMLPTNQNTMQSELLAFKEYCTGSKLTINQEKSKAMLFNRAKKHDFSPELYLTPGSRLEVVEVMKLVGYQLRSDMRTITNTEYIIKRAWKRMWVVRRLKTLGASEQELLSVLRAQVLSVLQFATPAWSTLITEKESAQIESVLKTGLYLVYGKKYESFSWALRQAKMSSLSEQRRKMFYNFTKGCIKSDKFKKWFATSEVPTGSVTRSKQTRFKPIPFRTQAFARSAIPQMVKLANSPEFEASRITIVQKSGHVIEV